MKHNYHGHTTFCKHSNLTVEELVVLHIESNIKTCGISEHMPLPNIKGQNRINDIETLREFILECQRIKEKYKDKIDVKIGLECEILNPYTGEYLDQYLLELKDSFPEVEYFIFGHHSYPNCQNAYIYKPTMEDMKLYVEAFKKAIDLNIFTYVAHPDCFYRAFESNNEILEYATKEIISKCAEKNIPLGFNINSFKSDIAFNFPNNIFFEKAKEYNCPVIIELDAHTNSVFNIETINKAYSVLKKIGITPIDELKI